MNVTLRTLLREFEFGTTYAPGERHHSRGVATAPAQGGRAVVFRRRAAAAPDTQLISDHASVATVMNTELEEQA